MFGRISSLRLRPQLARFRLTLDPVSGSTLATRCVGPTATARIPSDDTGTDLPSACDQTDRLEEQAQSQILDDELLPLPLRRSGNRERDGSVPDSPRAMNTDWRSPRPLRIQRQMTLSCCAVVAAGISSPAREASCRRALPRRNGLPRPCGGQAAPKACATACAASSVSHRGQAQRLR